MKDPEVTSVDPTVLIDRASQPAGTQPKGPQRPEPRGTKASEVVAVDPTVLIDRASQQAAPEPVEPTILVQRGKLPRRPAPPPQRPNPPGPRERASQAVDATVLVTPGARPAPPREKTSVAAGASQPSMWSRVKDLGGGRSSPSRHTSSRETQRGIFWTPAMRGAALALGALAVAGIVVLGVIWIPHGTSPPRLQLTLTKPYGGTIVGDGIECGTGGSDCNAEFREGERVELDTRADKGYAFTAFTGPCAPSGRVIINKALTCGAKFDRDDLPPPAATFPLTIEKPSGGTILVEPDIICGALQTMCSAKMAVGSHVKLNVQPEPGFVFLNFTNDCAPEGETTMSQARTCGATFGPAAPPRPPTPPPNVAARKTEGPRVSIEVPDKSGSTGAGQSTPGQNPAASSQGQQTPTSAQINPINPNPGPANQAVATSGSAPTNTGPVAAPITPEDHAKNEIQQLVKRYCDESQTLQPVRIKALYPQADLATMKDRFREYKSLQCTVAAPPEFERLDAREAGFAQVKFGMKQVIQMKSGGAPQTVETIVTMTVSRMDLQSPWLIDRLLHAPKPKP